MTDQSTLEALHTAREALFRLRDLAEAVWDHEAANLISAALRQTVAPIIAADRANTLPKQEASTYTIEMANERARRLGTAILHGLQENAGNHSAANSEAGRQAVIRQYCVMGDPKNAARVRQISEDEAEGNPNLPEGAWIIEAGYNGGAGHTFVDLADLAAFVAKERPELLFPSAATGGSDPINKA